MVIELCSYYVSIMCNLEKAFEAAQQYIIFKSLLSHESQIHSILIQKPNMIEQSQQ